MTKRLHSLLQAARQHEFIGRSQLLTAFQEWTSQAAPDHYLHFIQGGLGMGKTALLRQFQEYCSVQGIPALYLHGAEVQPEPSSFLTLLQQRWGEGTTDLPNVFEDFGQRVVLLVDAYEQLLPLDDWFRLDWLPQLPPNVLVVLASRMPPSAGWLTDLGWQPYLRISQLTPFTAAETAVFLSRRGLPQSELAPIFGLTGGNPLALHLVASSFAEAPWSSPFCIKQNPSLLQRLFQQLIAPIASTPAHQLLELVALVRQVTESLLESILTPAEARRSFEWLRAQPWMQRSQHGLVMEGAMRELILADLEWRNPEGLRDLQRRVSDFLTQQLQQHPELTNWRYLQELAYLHRRQPQLEDWLSKASCWNDYSASLAHPADLAAWANLIEQQEGRSASKAWLDRSTWPGTSVTVWRNQHGHRVAYRFMFHAAAGAIPSQLGFPALELPEVSATETVAWTAWWLPALDAKEAAALTGVLIWESLHQALQTTPALSMVYCPNWLTWTEQVPALTTFPWDQVAPTAPMSAWRWIDWRLQAPLAWLTEWLHQPQVIAGTAPAAAPVVILGEKAFLQAAALALKHYHERDVLLDNPLLRSRLVARLLGAEAPNDALLRLQHLQLAINRAMALLEDAPHDARYHRVLYRTFINPVGSREKTADFLNLSFSTYRRYVKAGVARLCQLLWRMEMDPALLPATDRRLKQTA